MFDGEITLDDLEAELAEFAASKKPDNGLWEPEHDTLLLKARDDLGMFWTHIEQFWKERFGWGCQNTLLKRYRELKESDD